MADFNNYNDNNNMNNDQAPENYPGPANMYEGFSPNSGNSGNFKNSGSEKKGSFSKGLVTGIAIGVAFCLVFAFFGGRIASIISSFSSSSSSSELTYEQKVEAIKEYIDKYYIDDVDEETLDDASLKGLLSGLGDDYAVYYTAEEMADIVEADNGEYAGIGVSVSMNDDGEIYVYRVFDDTPAKEAGLQVGDIITEAAGVTEFETLEALVSVVKGEVGTTVDITVDRDGQELEFTIERRKITIESVSYEMLDNNIGYIYIMEFNLLTTDQFNEAIEDLLSQGMESLILDLRDNPGGLLDTVVAMSDRVLPEGVILTVENASGEITTYSSDEENQLDIPMVAIINENSASASEVFVGALKDYGVATVVGETSFGKGIVQSMWQFSDGSGMKFTTDRYYTPNGTSLDGVGITPDIEVSLPEDAYDDGILTDEEDTQLQAAIEVLTE